MGISYGQSWDAYRQINKLNASTLVAGLRSMLALKNAIDVDTSEQTDAMRLGTAIHSAVLEPAEFSTRYETMPAFHLDAENVTAAGKPSRSKATAYYKQKAEEWELELSRSGRESLKLTERRTCQACIDAIERKPHIASLISQSEHEVTVEGEISGVAIKGRIDCLNSDTLADLKTTNDASPHAFGRTFANLHYGFRLAIYRELVRQATGKVPDVLVIAQETAGEFDTVLYHVPECVLDHGLSQVQRVVSQLKQCRESGEWPGIDCGMPQIELVVPQWAMEDAGDELDWSGVGTTEEPEVYF